MKLWTSAWMVLITLLILTTIRWWDPLPVEILRLKTFDLYQVTQDQKYGENVTLYDIEAVSYTHLTLPTIYSV